MRHTNSDELKNKENNEKKKLNNKYTSKEIKNEKIKSKSIFINLQKEEEEDRELLELLEGKRKIII